MWGLAAQKKEDCQNDPPKRTYFRMKKFRNGAKPLCSFLVLTLIFFQFPVGIAKASIISTEQIIETASTEQKRERILVFLARKEVRDKLISLGVEPEEAAARIKTLSNREIKRVAAEIDNLPAGQGGVGVIVGAILIVFLVLLVTDAIGATDVFPFVKKVRNN